MERPLVDKYVDLSEQQTTPEKKEYYWNLAEKIDNIYTVMERAKKLDDRNLVIRCCENVLKYAELGEEKTTLTWIEKSVKSNELYNKLRKTI